MGTMFKYGTPPSLNVGDHQRLQQMHEQRYLEEYKKRCSASDAAVSFLQGKGDPGYNLENALREKYRCVRESEGKVPALYVYEELAKVKFYPSLTLDKPVAGALEAREKDGVLAVYLQGISIVAFSRNMQDHIGRRVDIQEEGLQGRLFFNSDFFQRFDLPKRRDAYSDMRNIASSYFKVNGKNHVALVQYLHPEGRSAEHYHTLPETIVQVAGNSFLVVRPVEQDTSVKSIEMTPGKMYQIQPSHLHQVFTRDEGSITLPMKQTHPRRKDHFSYEMSPARIRQELNEMIHAHYESGTALMMMLRSYCSDLKPQEKEHAQRYFSDLRGKNPNIDRVLQELNF